MATLPTPRHFVARLISTIPKPSYSEASSANPLGGGPEVKQPLLTLHVLFPNEFLPALDLLDRGLITRLLPPGFRNIPSAVDNAQPQAETDPTHGQAPHHTGDHGVQTPNLEAGQQDRIASLRTADMRVGSTSTEDAAQQKNDAKAPCLYYVRSAQQQTSRSSNSRYRNAAYEHTTYYEVRLDAWSCSCPAFAFSAFPATTSDAHRTSPPSLDARNDEQAPLGWLFGGLTLGTDMPVCKHLLACVLVEHSGMFAHFVEERTVSREEMAGWAAGWGD